MRVHLVSISSKIYEDSYYDGEGAFTGAGLSRKPIGKTFASMTDAVNWLADKWGFPIGPGEDYEVDSAHIYSSKMVADHSEEQNGGWMEPTSKEKQLWKRGEYPLYTETMYIKYIETP